MSRAQAVAGDVGARRLRDAIGHFATGVGVVTAAGDDGRLHGSTVNAISSVSLEPPLVLVCLRHESETLAALLERGRFAVSLLRHDQRAHAERFARRGDDGAWAEVAHRSGAGGAPLLDDAVATLECVLHDVADGGDHRIVVGRVVAVDHGHEHVAPLLFYRGAFATLGEPAAAEAVVPAAAEPSREVVASLPSQLGMLRLVGVEEGAGPTSVLVLLGEPHGRAGVPLHVHHACVLGDALGHLGCARAEALRMALHAMRAAGHGVVVYRRDEAVPYGSCCLPEIVRASPSAPSARLRDAVARLRLTRAELLLASDERAPATVAADLGLDVARTRRWRDGAWRDGDARG